MANAAVLPLEGRLPATPGGTDYQAYYDPNLDITWAADADINGYDTWANQMAWVAGLTINGVDGWRLPRTLNPDATCGDPVLSNGFNCTGSEMGYLYYEEGITAAAPGPFSNVQLGGHWSGNEYDSFKTWRFIFDDGYQSIRSKDLGFFAWAVHSGDVNAAVLPLEGRLPATLGGTDYQAYYDPNLDITWADVNISGIGGVPWDEATSWAANLTINGVTGWRLPNMDVNGDGTVVDCSGGGVGGVAGCADNELGYLYWEEGITKYAKDPFSTVWIGLNWSSTEIDPIRAWALNFSFNGDQFPVGKVNGLLAWAVHSGDVSAATIRDQGQIFSTGGALQLGTDEWSQSITTGIKGQLAEIQIQFHFGVPTPPPALNLSIFNGGNPISGSALFSEQLFITSADLDDLDVFTWDLSSARLFFDVGDVFSFVLQADGAGYDIAGNDPPGYDGGDLFKNRVAFTELSDIAFITYVKPSPIPPPGVMIDIKPGNKRNIINPRAKGGVWVAVLSDTDPSSPFDPASQVDIPTVEFGPDGAKVTRHKVKDKNKDGLGDLLLRFKIPETGIACGDTEATLSGETFDGQSFTGTDSIKTVGCKPKKHHKKKHHKKHK
jgi:hypothetical protein